VQPLQLQRRRSRIHINRVRIRAFLADSAAKNSPRWVYEQRLYLEWWRKRLNGERTAVCLRQKDFLERIAEILQQAHSAQYHRLAVIKRFCSWLVERGELTPIEHQLEGLTVSFFD